MSFEKYLRQKQIEKEAKEAASKSVNEVVRKMMKSEFEKAFKKEYPHADYLACLKFDEVENQYKPINEEVEPQM